MPAELDYSFQAMGSEVRLLIASPLAPTAASPLAAADREKAFVLDFGSRLSRFRTDSELSSLNHSPLERTPASGLLRRAVRAGLWAAARSGGLVDPTLVHALERAGYDHSLKDVAPASLSDALRSAPARRAAQPHPAELWRRITVNDELGYIERPPGVAIDTGGTGKGLCADMVARHLSAYTRFAVDCGGDIAVGGVGAHFNPYMVEVEHPLTGRSIGTIAVSAGGVATSGLNVRIWSRADGSFAHHLLDPSSGEPAWSGLIGATALGSSALEAETLSKLALLLGPDQAREVLAQQGGVIFHEDGTAEVIGPVRGSVTELAVAQCN